MSYTPEGQAMSILRRLRFANRIHRTIVLTVSILFVASAVSAAPRLWLYPKDAGPREGGHVVSPGDFVLVIDNRAKDTIADAAHLVQLVIAVKNPEAITSLELVFDGGPPVSLDPGSWEVGTPTLPCTGGSMPRHGVYPTAFAQVLLENLTGSGDIAGGETVEISVEMEGGDDLWLHFDAMAEGYKKNGRCFDVSNPAGHDVTVANRRGGHDGCGHVTVTKTADPTSIDPGSEVTFVIEVLNDGTCDLNEGILRDFIPAVEGEDGIEYPAFRPLDTEVPPYLSDDGLVLEWPLESPLPVDQNFTVEFDVVFDNPLVDQMKVVNRACVSAAELRKKRCAAAVVTVGNPYGDDGPAGPGFWCHATRWILEGREKLPVDGEELLTWLVNVNAGSAVFSGLVVEGDSEASLVAAKDLLCTPQSAQGAADRLQRHLLVLWLNIESDRLDEDQTLGDLCMGDEILPEGADLGMTVWDVVLAAESALMEAADDGLLSFWSEVIDAINNSYVAGEGECLDRRTLTRRHRAGNGRPHGKSSVSINNN